MIAPDLRGFGESDKPDKVDDYRMRHLVGDVRGLLDACAVERVAVVGHDWGSALAWAVATYLPDRVNALVPISVGHGMSRAASGERQRQLSWYMLWFLFPGVAERVLPADDWAAFRTWAWPGELPASGSDIDRQIADLSRPGALAAALNWYRANIKPEQYVVVTPPAPAPRIACPTMGIWSDGDPYLDEVQMTASADAVSGSWRYERLTEVGHWIPVQAPDRLNRLLLDFFASTARR